MNQSPAKNRILYIDLLRVISCFLVILTHSHFVNECETYESKIFVLSIMFICMPAAELFISLSGATLLPIQTEMKTFIKKRLKKILNPFIFWSIVIAILIKGTDNLISNLFLIPFKPITFEYWFIYVIVGLYLIAPIITPWLKTVSKKQLEFVLTIWLISLLIPFWNQYSNVLYLYTGNYNYTLYYLSGFIGYWLLGLYLREYPIKIGLNWRFLVCLGVFFIYILYIYICYIQQNYSETLTSNLQIGVASYLILIYTLVQHISIKSKHLISIISKIAKYSYGIYLIHPVIIFFLSKYILNDLQINMSIKIIILAISTFLSCYFICFFIKKTPISKYIIGI